MKLYRCVIGPAGWVVRAPGRDEAFVKVRERAATLGISGPEYAWQLPTAGEPAIVEESVLTQVAEMAVRRAADNGAVG